MTIDHGVEGISNINFKVNTDSVAVCGTILMSLYLSAWTHSTYSCYMGHIQIFEALSNHYFTQEHSRLLIAMDFT